MTTYTETITRLLAMSPSGLTNEQLLWRLRRSGLRLSPGDILQTLAMLADTGIAGVSAVGRWRLAQFEHPPPGRNADARTVTVPGPTHVVTLRAVTAFATPRAVGDAIDLVQNDPAADGAVRADADWRKLLAYYAATQRLDPRGAVDERADRHGLSWQLFRADGRWWDAGELRFAADALPPDFRESLIRRPGKACSLGYPIGLFNEADFPCFVPALLLPATYKFAGPEFIVEITTPEPALNPRWLEPALRRLRGWQRDQLIDALFPEGEDSGFEDVVRRLANAVATLGGTSLKPAQPGRELTIEGEGLRNVTGLFLPTDARFTQGAERDLDAIRDWPDDALRETSLLSLLCAIGASAAGADGTAPSEVVAPSGPQVLTDRQYDSAVSALGGPLTLIQGPPGTGKSEVILSLLTSIVLAGHSALLVSKNHRALDEVEERLARIVGDTPLLTRARDSDGERDTSFLAQMRLLADGDALPDREAAPDGAKDVLEPARRLLAIRLRRRHLTKLNLALSDAVERLERWNEAAPPAAAKPTGLGGLLHRFVAMLRRRIAPRTADDSDDRTAIAVRVQVLRCDLTDRANDPSAADADGLTQAVATEAAAALVRSAARLTTPDHAARQILADRLQALRFSGRTKPAQMTDEEARLVLRHRPIWAVSTLSVASRIPLRPALFDYVVFDEASQCDIASALPLFARARKAVVVGDPMQLGFIPQMSIRQEHALMDAVGLGPAARHGIAQSINSLFDFVRARGTASRHFLADQFRSDPSIVAYLNEAFYEGRLVAAQDERKARWPDGYKPGLAWHDVRGRPTREDGGNVNHAEADEIVRLLVGMIRERHFTGSIGVLSPFNTQVALLLRRIRTVLSEAERRDLRVATIDRFQGGEADVVIFSLVVASGVHPSALTFYDRERRRVNVAISRARALCLVAGDKEFARKSRVRTLAFLAEAVGRPPRPRDPFDSEWERRLHAALQRRGLEAIPQYPVGSRYLDFALDPEGTKLDVEVDGRRWHADPDGNRKVADRLRDRELIARGWKVRRFWVHELAEDMEKCVDLVERDLGHA